MRIVMIACLIAVTAIRVHAQKMVVSGQITDAKSGEALISANIFNKNSLKGVVTNHYGFYSIYLDKGKHTLVCSYVGYQSKEIELNVQQNQTLNINLEPTVTIEEVTVTGNSIQQKVASTQMSTTELPLKAVEQLPVLLGEVDVIKSLQLMPGVQSGTEGSTGLYVRGGGPDQNLILLDGVPVYNVNHLFGFFSVFNSDALKSVTLTKGGFPARYGGRLSSVVDIRMKEGNMKEYKAYGSIGFLSSKLTLEGPIIKDKTSFLVSGRRSYFDVFYKPFEKLLNSDSYMGDETKTTFYFYDLNAKINHIVNDKNRLYLSGYFGRDKFGSKSSAVTDDPFARIYNSSKDDYGIQWGNATGTLRWNHIYNYRLFSNLSLTFTDYSFNNDELKEQEKRDEEKYYKNTSSIKYHSKIRDYAIKYDFDYSFLPNHFLRFGLSNTYHSFDPGVTLFFKGDEDGANIDTTVGKAGIPANEFYAYMEDDFTINSRLKVNLGFHYGNYYVEEHMYHSFEPRISGRYMLKDNLSLKLSFVTMSQNINLLSNSTIGLPNDLWVPSTKRIKPQKTWQIASGINWGISDQLELNIEGYYKQMYNLVEYLEGASFYNTREDWQDLVAQGKGNSYGAEVFFRKTAGKTTGWIGYTLSWSNRSFDEINNGKVFPYHYDRRHDISIVLTHKFDERYDIGASWVFATGNAFTFGDEVYMEYAEYLNRMGEEGDPYNVITSSSFEARNDYRMPAYHRLDLGLNYHKKKRHALTTWSVGAYNVYARSNPFYIYTESKYSPQHNDWLTELKQFSLLKFVPYLRYSFTF